MNPNSDVQKKVGLFIFIGLVVFITSVMLVGGDRVLFKKQSLFKAHFETVQGINKGSIVSLAGLNVGNVKKIEFLHDKNVIEVTFKIAAEEASKLTEGTTVEVRTQGALGDKFLYINPGPMSAAVIAEESVLPIAKPTDLIGVLGERGGEISKVFEILSEMHRMMKSINDGNKAGKLMDNLSEAAVSLNHTAKSADRYVSIITEKNDLANSIRHLDSVLAKIDRGEGTLGALVNDPSLHNQLKSLLGADQKKKTVKSLLRTSIEKSE